MNGEITISVIIAAVLAVITTVIAIRKYENSKDNIQRGNTNIPVVINNDNSVKARRTTSANRRNSNHARKAETEVKTEVKTEHKAKAATPCGNCPRMNYVRCGNFYHRHYVYCDSCEPPRYDGY